MLKEESANETSRIFSSDSNFNFRLDKAFFDPKFSSHYYYFCCYYFIQSPTMYFVQVQSYVVPKISPGKALSL